MLNLNNRGKKHPKILIDEAIDESFSQENERTDPMTN